MFVILKFIREERRKALRCLFVFGRIVCWPCWRRIDSILIQWQRHSCIFIHKTYFFSYLFLISICICTILIQQQKRDSFSVPAWGAFSLLTLCWRQPLSWIFTNIETNILFFRQIHFQAETDTILYVADVSFQIN